MAAGTFGFGRGWALPASNTGQADDSGGTSERLTLLRTANSGLPLSNIPQKQLSPLEILPVEIHEQIFLKLPTLQDLCSLVHASPHLHAIYAQHRAAILSGALYTNLGHIWFDAQYCYISGKGDFQKVRTSMSIWESFSAYQDRLASPSTLFIKQQPLEDAVAMVRFHADVIEPLSQRYAAWALAALHPTHDAGHPSMTPSKTETLRIYRGLYRLQIFCNLCGHVPNKSYSTWRLTNIDCTLLLSHFPAWQVEEILCVQEFAKDRYDRVFHQVAWDLDEVHNPAWADRRLLRGVYEGLELTHKRRPYYMSARNAVLVQGLPLLSTVFGLSEHGKMVELMRKSIESGWDFQTTSYGDWITAVVETWMIEGRYGEWPQCEDKFKDGQQAMRFSHDSVDWPPQAWVILFKNRYSNLFGRYVPDAVRRWGYVFWDASRLGAGAKEYLVAEWDACHGEMDPRDREEPA